jgi:pilus assembly protein CpaE
MSSLKLNCAVISAVVETVDLYARELAHSPSVGSITRLPEYPSNEALSRALRLDAIDLVVIDCADFDHALRVVSAVRAASTPIEVIAVCEERVETLSSLLRLGVRDYIPAGAPLDAARGLLADAIARWHSQPQSSRLAGDLIAFLPGKPGSGASTIAANYALRLADVGRKRVFLADFDRDAPVQSFLHRLRPAHFLQDAIEAAHHLDGALWSRLVSHHAGLDILPADANGAVFESGRTRHLLDFVRRAYDVACLDLPGPLDSTSIEALAEAKRIYLVSTQELASVHLALRKAARLRDLGLGSQVRLLVNRFDSASVMTAGRIEEVIGLPVEITIPNSYALASAAAAEGVEVDSGSPLGKSYARLISLLYDIPVEAPRKQRNLLDLLAQPFQRPGRQVN